MSALADIFGDSDIIKPRELPTCLLVIRWLLTTISDPTGTSSVPLEKARD